MADKRRRDHQAGKDRGRGGNGDKDRRSAPYGNGYDRGYNRNYNYDGYNYNNYHGDGGSYSGQGTGGYAEDGYNSGGKGPSNPPSNTKNNNHQQQNTQQTPQSGKDKNKNQYRDSGGFCEPAAVSDGNCSAKCPEGLFKSVFDSQGKIKDDIDSSRQKGVFFSIPIDPENETPESFSRKAMELGSQLKDHTPTIDPHMLGAIDRCSKMTVEEHQTHRRKVIDHWKTRRAVLNSSGMPVDRLAAALLKEMIGKCKPSILASSPHLFTSLASAFQMVGETGFPGIFDSFDLGEKELILKICIS